MLNVANKPIMLSVVILSVVYLFGYDRNLQVYNTALAN